MIIKIKDDAFEPMKTIGTLEFEDVKIEITTNVELGKKIIETITSSGSYTDFRNKLTSIEELFEVDIDTEFSSGEYDYNIVDGCHTLDYYEKNGERFEIWFENSTIHTLFKGVESEFSIYGLEAMLSDTAFSVRNEIIASLTYTRLVSATGININFEEWKNKKFVFQFISKTAMEY